MKLENEFTVPVDIDTVYAALNDPEKVTPCFPGATLDSHEGDDFTGTVKVKLGPISMTYKGKGTFVERDSTNHKVVVDASGRDSRGNGTASAKATLTMTSDGGKTKVNVLTEMQVTGKPAQFGRGVMADVGDKILGQFAACLADEFADAPADAPASAPADGDASPSAASPSSGTASSGTATAGVTPVTGPPSPSPVAAGSGPPAGVEMPSTVGEARKDSAGVAAVTAAGAGAAAASSPRPSQPAASQTRRPQAEAIDLLDSSRDAVLKRLVPVGIGAGVLAALVAIIMVLRKRSG